MRDGHRVLHPGMSVHDHQQCGQTLREVRTQLLEVRRTVGAGEGTSSREYIECSRALRAVQNLETVLRQSASALVDAVPRADWQALYGDGEG